MQYHRINLAFNSNDPMHMRAYRLIASQGRRKQSQFIVDLVAGHFDEDGNRLESSLEALLRNVVRDEVSALLDGRIVHQAPDSSALPESTPREPATDDDTAALAAMQALGDF